MTDYQMTEKTSKCITALEDYLKAKESIKEAVKAVYKEERHKTALSDLENMFGGADDKLTKYLAHLMGCSISQDIHRNFPDIKLNDDTL